MNAVLPDITAAVIAGQGAVAPELLVQAPGLDAIVALMGEGGLVSGIAMATHAFVLAVVLKLPRFFSGRTLSGAHVDVDLLPW